MVAAATRAQARERGNPKLLEVKEVTSKAAVDKKELVRLQEDSTLQKFKYAKGRETKKRDTAFLTKNEEEFGTGYVRRMIK